MPALGLALGLPFVMPRSGQAALDAWLAGATYADWDPTVIASLAQNSDGTTPVTTNGDPVGRALDQGPGGFNATQVTAGDRPPYLDGYFNPDGTSDNLLTTWLLGAGANTIIAKWIVPASLGGWRVQCGAYGGGDTYFVVGVNTGGLECYVGAASLQRGSIKDLQGSTVVVALVDDGVTVNLYLYKDATATTEYSGARGSGIPTTLVSVRIGAYNDSGTPASFSNVDIGRTIAAHKVMTLEEFTAIAPLLAA